MSPDNHPRPDKPIIGIVPTFNFEEETLSLPERYVKAVVAAGGAPIVLPFTTDVSVYETLLPTMDGFLLSGGQDISPVRYGGDITYGKLSELSPNREETEYLILSFAKKYDVPILGICRGMQMMNVSFGGTLYQDLGEQFHGSSEDSCIDLSAETDSSGEKSPCQTCPMNNSNGSDLHDTEDIHKPRMLSSSQIPSQGSSPSPLSPCITDGFDPKCRNYMESKHWQLCDYKTPTHRVELVEGTRLAKILDIPHINVNSMHHQGICNLAEGLRASAYDLDGLIEAIESPDHAFMIGVQWHPEFLIEDGHMDKLFNALIKAAAGSKRKSVGCPACIRIMRQECGGCFPLINFESDTNL